MNEKYLSEDSSTDVLLINSHYSRIILGYGFSPTACHLIRVYSGTYVISASFIGLEVYIIRFLYTTIWPNLGLAHCDFWKRFVKLFNIVMVTCVAIILHMMNVSKGFDAAICANIQPHEIAADLYFSSIVRPINSLLTSTNLV